MNDRTRGMARGVVVLVIMAVALIMRVAAGADIELLLFGMAAGAGTILGVILIGSARNG